MTLIATSKPVESHVVKYEDLPEHGWCRANITLNDSAADLVIGTVLGKVTATGKYKVAVETAVDGSKVADAILAKNISLAAATDTVVQVWIRGKLIVNKSTLVLDATYDNDAKKQAVYDALMAKDIRASETLSPVTVQ